jgi:hypothetical protein
MWVSVMLLVVGAAIVVWAWWETLLQGRLRREGVSTDGTVVRYEESDELDGGRRRRSYPIVAYTDTAGDRQECQGAGSRSGWQVGTRVEVLYLPGRPRSARIATAAERVKAISVLVLGGLGLMAVGVLIAVMG